MNDSELEFELKKCYLKLQDMLRKMNNKPAENLTTLEKSTLKKFKAKDFTFLPSDKGREFCVLTTANYDEAANNHLENRDVYERVKSMSALTIETKLNRAWKKICQQSKIEPRIVRSFVSNNTDLPKFYHLIKTHKNDRNMKIRPIVSNKNGPSHKLSWLLTRLLQPLVLSTSSHLQNSDELMQNIKTLSNATRKRFSYPFSLDVISLYTSVSPQEAIQVVKEKLNDEFRNLCPFDANQIAEILEIITMNTYFTFKNQTYRQVTGLPMGNGISATLALLYMDKIEKQVVSNCHLIGLYKRYVDDILILTTNKESASEIFQQMNAIDTCIQFEIEHPDEDNSLSSLDFRIAICEDGAAHFRFYKKAAKRNMFPHAKSAIPTETKFHSVTNELKRIRERCTSNEDTERCTTDFYNELNNRGYLDPKRRFKQRRHNREKSKPDNICYFEFPFINDKIHHAVKRIFHTSKLPVQVYSRSRTLRSALQPKQTPQQCNVRDCPLANDLCLCKNTVYSMTCQRCQEQYIGSSIRALHTRVKEHIRGPSSSVFKHRTNCKADFTVSVIAKDNVINRLRFKEAITIKERQPKINSKQEREELLHLLF